MKRIHESWGFMRPNENEKYEDFMDHYTDRSKYTDFDQFCCTDEDLDHWRVNGTWRTPPIILDLNSMKRISDLNKGEIAMKYKIYLMKGKRTNAQSSRRLTPKTRSQYTSYYLSRTYGRGHSAYRPVPLLPINIWRCLKLLLIHLRGEQKNKL